MLPPSIATACLSFCRISLFSRRCVAIALNIFRAIGNSAAWITRVSFARLRTARAQTIH
jgi:hypothetical protein